MWCEQLDIQGRFNYSITYFLLFEIELRRTCNAAHVRKILIWNEFFLGRPEPAILHIKQEHKEATSLISVMSAD